MNNMNYINEVVKQILENGGDEANGPATTIEEVKLRLDAAEAFLLDTLTDAAKQAA